MPSHQLDMSSDPPRRSPQSGGGNCSGTSGQGRRFVGVKFDCCGVYQRVYVNRAGTAYEGRCPRCLKPVRLRIGPGGTDQRFFHAR